MNYQATGVNYPEKKKRKKKKHGSCAHGPRVPFPIQRVIFLKCRREEKRSSLEEVRVG